jgi:Branched-chain amino acid transport system / permease component
MSSVEVPIAPARTPLAPRLVELLSGDWRYVPILTAIVLIWILFGVWDPKFLSPRNLSNLSLQSVVTGILALGLVPVLIIRQIDMSVAAVSAVAGTITGQMLIVFDAPVSLAIAAGVAFGAAVGFVQGRWITWTKTPGFLVTFGVSLILALFSCGCFRRRARSTCSARICSSPVLRRCDLLDCVSNAGRRAAMATHRATWGVDARSGSQASPQRADGSRPRQRPQRRQDGA